MLVAIAEDDPDLRFMLDLLLREQGYEVVMTSDGEAAIREARGRRPNLLVLDYNMPGSLDGGAVLRTLKGDPETVGIPVVIVSADNDDTRRTECLAAGALAYLVKPYQIEDLIQLVAAQREGP